MKTMVEASVAVAGQHRWAQAQEPVGFLAVPHRHLFVIRARKVVAHDDRDVEFITLGETIREYLKATHERTPLGHLDFKGMSCEAIARSLVAEFGLTYCSVHEDDENGAIVCE